MISKIATDLTNCFYNPEGLNPNSWLADGVEYHPKAISNFTNSLTKLFNKYLVAGETELTVQFGKCGSKGCHLGKKGFALVGARTKNYTPLMVEFTHNKYEVFNCSDLRTGTSETLNNKFELKLTPFSGLLYNPSPEREIEQLVIASAIEEVHSWGDEVVPYETYEAWYKKYGTYHEHEKTGTYDFILDKRKGDFNELCRVITYLIKGKTEREKYTQLLDKYRSWKTGLDSESIALALTAEKLEIPTPILIASELDKDKEPVVAVDNGEYTLKLYMDDAEAYVRYLNVLSTIRWEAHDTLKEKLSSKLNADDFYTTRRLIELYESSTLEK